MFPLKHLKWHPCCVNKSSSVTLMSWLTVWRLPKTSNHIRAWLVFQTWLQQVYHWPVPLSHNLWNQHQYNRNRFRTSPAGWNRPRKRENVRNNGIAHETYCALFVSNRGIFYVRRQWASSVDLVGWKKHPCNSRRNWRRSKNGKSHQTFCTATPFDWHFQHFQFTEKGECWVFSARSQKVS